jgi:hypothetical protein
MVVRGEEVGSGVVAITVVRERLRPDAAFSVSADDPSFLVVRYRHWS